MSGTNKTAEGADEGQRKKASSDGAYVASGTMASGVKPSSMGRLPDASGIVKHFSGFYHDGEVYGAGERTGGADLNAIKSSKAVRFRSLSAFLPAKWDRPRFSASPAG